MNSLSWLLYFASLSDSAASFLSFLALLGAVVAIIGLILSLMWTDGSYRAEERIKGYDRMNKQGRDLMPRGFLVLIVCGSIAVLLPNKNTVYAIAASEVGERAVKSELASDATKALQQWIKKQIAPEETKK